MKEIFAFGGGTADGNAEMGELLGGKGANLAEMARLGIPVPPGFTITTEVCNWFNKHNQSYPEGLENSVHAALSKIEKELEFKFGDPTRPLLVSVRSGARVSMPGMMETVLNVGLNDCTRGGLISTSKDPLFVYDAQRRLIQMYSDVVMEKAAGIVPLEGQGIRLKLEHELEKLKQNRNITDDTELSADDLKALVSIYKAKVLNVLDKEFPEDPWEQLWGAITAVFQSWNGKRAMAYRRIESLPDEWGTAVNVQAMVFGNQSVKSGTGVAFTRNPSTGENALYGEWLPQAQGEDVVAGIRTPNPLNGHSRTEHSGDLPSLEEEHPASYRELARIRDSLEQQYRDMLDIEFTIQTNRLWILQCRVGKRNGAAAVRMAIEMERSGLISPDEAIMRVTPSQLEELLYPTIDPQTENTAKLLARGLPAGPGSATGRVVFTADDAVEWAQRGEKVVLVREETNPEDVAGIRASIAILTARGGMTSHAALVARGWGLCAIVGADALEIDAPARRFSVCNHTIAEGDLVTLNGTTGKVYAGELPLTETDIESEQLLHFLSLCDRKRKLKIRTNADTPIDAKRARGFGAEGIGLFRIEHMFYGQGSEEPLFHLQRMIMSGSLKERRAALADLYPHIRDDIRETLRVMEGLPVTIRLMDPPLHEFIPHEAQRQAELMKTLGIDSTEFERRIEQLKETNPMMGHRGVRLGVTYPEITEMQSKAILVAATELQLEGVSTLPEIMVPLTASETEFSHQEQIVRQVAKEVQEARACKLDYLVGTMIEIPRAALMADKIAETAQFFSYGTNDLTQTTFGFSRDDSSGFLHEYIEKGILSADPFSTLDEGVGELIKLGVERGRGTRADLKIGICGEHGGDPASIAFCHAVGMDYVSCSPFRVPVARLSAAQSLLNQEASFPRQLDLLNSRFIRLLSEPSPSSGRHPRVL